MRCLCGERQGNRKRGQRERRGELIVTYDYEDFPGYGGLVQVAADDRNEQIWIKFEESEDDQGDEAETVAVCMGARDVPRFAEFLAAKVREALATRNARDYG
jgi:hypothetical protein